MGGGRGRGRKKGWEVKVVPPNYTVIPPSVAAIYNRGTVLSILLGLHSPLPLPPNILSSRLSYAHRLL